LRATRKVFPIKTYGRPASQCVGRSFLFYDGLLRFRKVNDPRNRIKIRPMFHMSADDAGWLITLIVAVALMAIVAGAYWLWR
jgi:hypothetical protein